MLSGAGSYILKFKFQEKWWGVDATKMIVLWAA